MSDYLSDKELFDLEFAKDDSGVELSEDAKKAQALLQLKASLLPERTEAINERRRLIDERLSKSARLYAGQRDGNGDETFDSLVEKPQAGSRVYMNITRQITNDGGSQLGDLMFPSDDRNWGIKAVALAPPPMSLMNEPAVNSKGAPLDNGEGQPMTNKEAHQLRLERVRAKTKRMDKKLDSAFTKARYAKKGRQAIRDAALYGTGILKGPIAAKAGSAWAKRKKGGYGLRQLKGFVPDLKVVSPFDFFPDMSASEMEECGYIWERSYLRPDELQKTPKTLNFNKSVVERKLVAKPSPSTLMEDAARLEASEKDTYTQPAKGRFAVWERRGYVERRLLLEAGLELQSTDAYVDAVVYFVEDEVAAVAENPLSKDDPIYSTFVWDEDPDCIFGYGIPYLMEHAQLVYVAAWRMALDNGGKSANPQVIIDRKTITPADGTGDYTVKPGKEWLKTGDNYSNERTDKPFEVVHITQNLQQVFAMMDKAENTAYVVTGVTRVDKTQQMNDNAPVTLGATQIQQNNSSVSRRAQARRYDDMITSTLVTRFYDFFMLFEPDDDIKAQMEIEPRGSTVLLAKELQATNLMQFYQITNGGNDEGVKGVELKRAIANAMHFSEGRFLMTDDEMAKQAEAAAQQEPQLTPEQDLQRREIEVKEANVELDQSKLQLEAQKVAHELRLKEETAAANIEIELAKLTDKQADRVNKQELEILKLTSEQELKASLTQTVEQNKRDIVATSLASDRQKERAKTDKDTAELALRAQEANRKDAELAHKQATGQPGI